MELIGSLLLILAVAIFVALFVARPFLKQGFAHTRTLEAVQRREHERSSLLAERDRLLNALQDLDFDHALGKVPEEDYPVMRGDLLRSGAEVLRRLEVFEAPTSQASAEERIEAAVAAHRADSARQDASARRAGETRTGGAIRANGKSQSTTQRDPIEDLIASRKRVRQESASGFCPHCGKPAQKSDKFCAKCGAAL